MDPTQKLILRLGIALAMLLVAGLLWYFSRWRDVAQIKDGKAIIRYNPFYRISAVVLFYVCLAIPLALIIAVLALPMNDPRGYMIAGCLAAFFGLGGLFVGREYPQGYATISHEGIEKYSPWWGRSFLAWSDVKLVRANANGSVILRGKNAKTLRFAAYWSGLGILLEVAHKELDSSQIEVME